MTYVCTPSRAEVQPTRLCLASEGGNDSPLRRHQAPVPLFVERVLDVIRRFRGNIGLLIL